MKKRGIDLILQAQGGNSKAPVPESPPPPDASLVFTIAGQKQHIEWIVSRLQQHLNKGHTKAGEALLRVLLVVRELNLLEGEQNDIQGLLDSIGDTWSHDGGDSK